MDNKAIPPLTVTIRTREKILFQGETHSVTSTNDRGLFDVLPEHENFISIVKEKIVLNGTDKTFPFTTGILRVEENKVTVYVGITHEEKTTLESPQN